MTAEDVLSFFFRSLTDSEHEESSRIVDCLMPVVRIPMEGFGIKKTGLNAMFSVGSPNDSYITRLSKIIIEDENDHIRYLCLQGIDWYNSGREPVCQIVEVREVTNSQRVRIEKIQSCINIAKSFLTYASSHLDSAKKESKKPANERVTPLSAV